MPKQTYLPLGRPSVSPGFIEHIETGHFSMMVMVTAGTRAQWSDDYYERFVMPDRPALTVADCAANSARKDAWRARHAEWQRQMVREGRAKFVARHSVQHEFELNAGETPFEGFEDRNAAGEYDARLIAHTGDSRIPAVNVDGEVYRAGERGNDRRVIRAEIMGTAFDHAERRDLLELLDSPQTWDRIVIRRMKIGDLGPETERLIRESNLTPDMRENLMENLIVLRGLPPECRLL